MFLPSFHQEGENIVQFLLMKNFIFLVDVVWVYHMLQTSCSIDISRHFTMVNISSLPWTDLSSIPGLTNKTGATASVDETTIFYIGGRHSGGLVSKFDTISQQWSEPATFGPIPTSGFCKPFEEINIIKSVILGHKIYIYGGFGVNKMNVLDTLQLYWSTFSSTLTYSGLQGYIVTLLNNNLILYIGGGFNSPSICQSNSNNELPVSIYNISDNSWSMVTTSGQVPSGKCHYSSVYIPQHHRILLFYGANDATINSLDTLTFTCTIPMILNTGGPLRSLRAHTSTLIGAYVLIAFGYYESDNGLLDSSDIFLLDVSHKDSYKWVSAYDPTNSIQPIPTPPTSPSTINIGFVIVSAIIGGIIGVIVGFMAKTIMDRNRYYPINDATTQSAITDQELFQ
ncbi:galactose oxidase [Gigaspora margarita]|uniref:Galactose oxidase n=1 Tax=Gigaspora margarita TaxID=4874 RepID=A0A8H4AU66_GIGMA|nr:galactose oxidase [Gigaspora margarita]